MDTIAQVDAFFAGRPGQWALFEALSRALIVRYPGTQVRVMKTCIAFEDQKPYCYVSFPPKSLARDRGEHPIQVSISLSERMEHSRFAMVVPISKRRFTVHIVLGGQEEIDGELLSLIELSRQR